MKAQSTLQRPCATQYKEAGAVKTCTSKCVSDVETAVKAGECARAIKGTDTTIQAGSHSFDWVRIKLHGAKKEMWVERNVVLE